jgi:hypothetical protein
VFEKRVLMKIFGPKEENRREMKRWHNKLPRNVTKYYADEIKKMRRASMW